MPSTRLFIMRPQLALIAVALFALTTVCRSVHSNQLAAAAASAAAATSGYNHMDYAMPGYKKAAKASMYQNGGIANKQINNQAPLQQVVAVPVQAASAAAPVQQLHPAAASQVSDLLNQVHALTSGVQIPAATQGGDIKLNNHVSKVSIGNTKETNINHISHSVAPITMKSKTSQDIGPKKSNVGNQHAAYHQSPVTTTNGNGNYYSSKAKTHPTEEQHELKARLLDLASKATANSPSEPVLRFNSQTGVLERVPVDPNANLYKDKLHQALGLLNPKKLPADKLKAVLSDHDDDDHHDEAPLAADDGDVVVMPEAAEPEPEYADESEPAMEYALEEAPEEAAVEQVPTREEIVNQVRFELDDRLNRISDLLYFRPEFMNQLLDIDDPVELTPVESEFKRMVLCNSDEQFCGQPTASLPAIEHVPEEEPVAEEAEPEAAEPSHVEEDVDEDLMDDDEAASAPAASVAAKPRSKLARAAPGGARGSGRPMQVQQQQQQRRNSNGNGKHHAQQQQQQQQRPSGARSAANGRPMYQQQQAAAPRRVPLPAMANNSPYLVVPQQQQQQQHQPQQVRQARPAVAPVRVLQQQQRPQPQQQQQPQPQMQSYHQPQQLYQQPIYQHQQPQFQLQQQQQQPMRMPALAPRNGNNRQTLPSSKSGY